MGPEANRISPRRLLNPSTNMGPWNSMQDSSMTSRDMTKEELIRELKELRDKVAVLDSLDTPQRNWEPTTFREPQHEGSGAFYFDGPKFYHWTPSSQFSDVDRTLSEILKDLYYARESGPSTNFIHPDDLAVFARKFTMLRQGMTDIFYQNNRLSTNGHLISADLYSLALEKKEAERPAGIAVFYKYVSDEKLSGREIVSLEGGLRYLFDCIARESGSGINILTSCNNYVKSDEFTEQDVRWLYSSLLLGHARWSLPETMSYFVKNYSMQYVFISSAVPKLLKLTPSEILGRTDGELFGSWPVKSEEDDLAELLSGTHVHIYGLKTPQDSSDLIMESLRCVPQIVYGNRRLIFGTFSLYSRAECRVSQ